MIYNSKILPVQKKATDSLKKVPLKRRFKSDKRKQKRDRRSSVRDGVIVNLSYEFNRRRGFDRRRVQI